jgi:alpha-beta hydrolase superfamily lysophospholipase
MKLFFKNQAFSFELLRAVSYSGYQGAELGECLSIAANIKKGDFNSWFIEWNKTAERLQKLGELCLKNGRRISGREALLRSSNYYRTAEFFLSPDDPRRKVSYSQSVETFQKAMSNMDFHCEVVKIPYENSYLLGYFYRAASNEELIPKATLIMLGGFDSTCEELYFAGAAAAMKRGYNCLIFDGPGQGETLRIQKKPARFDFEVPVSAALDYLETRPEVDQTRIALMGMSMGGYYAPRAAAFNKRISACIAYDALYDMWTNMLDNNPKMQTAKRLSPAVVEFIMGLAMKTSISMRWTIQNSMWVFGLEHRYDLLKTVPQYTLREVAGQIECPMLILVGESDQLVSYKQSDELVKRLCCPFTVRVFTREEGAEEHCQEGNHSLFHQVVFDWLDEQLLSKPV